MNPLALLLFFLVLAAGAFVAFWRLAGQPSTKKREDWKGFLSSFAGTAFVLGVGFGSLMLQQADQARQRQDDERAQRQRQLNDENGQIKARLLYSVAQKKFELDIFLDKGMVNTGTIDRICDESKANAQEGSAALREEQARSDPEEVQFFKEVAERMFSSANYERNPLNRLMKPACRRA